MKRPYYIIFLILSVSVLSAQDVSLFQQLNGRYDYTAIGNTLNIQENGPTAPCNILTSSSAILNLNPDQSIIAAYLYWAGSGTGDFEVELNGIPISAERSFSDSLDPNRIFFAAFADVTEIVLNQGNIYYTISGFDIQSVIPPYCPSGTNFGGWAISVIYQDEDLPLNQLNIYDGLQSVPESLSITLDNLNVLDNEDAKIGFIAWEGDNALAVNEQLTINGNIISNPPLNPANNAFNGTNSFTGASDLYNMDIDVYNIQNNISIGDTSANITLTSGQDFVMINSIITVLNSQLPDATVVVNDYVIECNDQTIQVLYTVNNFNSTDSLPANTPIAFYADNVVVGQSETSNMLPIGGTESNSIFLTIPESLGESFKLLAIADDDGTMTGTITETNENNNSFSVNLELLLIPQPTLLADLSECNQGFETSTFNLYEAIDSLDVDENTITFYQSLNDLEIESNAVASPQFYTNIANPETIYARLEGEPCYEIFQFQLEVENCPPRIPEGFSPNNDNLNDHFNIQGLYNIFIDHELKIFNRYGDLIFQGDNENRWFGKINRGLNNNGNLVPVGTYYYILHFNDSNYQPYSGWVYVSY
ncbi:T9SS type B sorting domain-containing protein [Winogradskyella ursingii]|uniref:T9SS type B sorting domain-containing protein n=1 Tax=Winogradskyella ursingii TaxID=2686079 RepID=UPI00293BA4D5|nr:gliding motility-associated C-terminal domain-containing protein [Winogradskyella ursingii]